MGQISPLVWNEDTQAGYATAYGPFLPRPARTFTEGAFGPFSPILPVPVDSPRPGAELADPRRFQYPVGYNLPTPPGLDGFKMASFDTLDTLSRLHSITRTCIERRKMMIAGLEWDIVPTKEAAKAYQGSHSAMRDFGGRRAKAVKFFDRPDPDFDDWGSFQLALLEQLFVYDAMSLLLKPKRGRGLGRGILGSDLDCLSLLDGASIRPLLSLSGGRPRPPAPAYQQFLYGVPRSDIQSMWSGKDIEEAGLKGYEGPAFSVDQLIYRPAVPRVNSPYGFSLVEMALVVIMTGLQKQAYQLNYYNEGTVPAVYLSPGDVNMTPAQIRELQAALNAVAGDQAWHHKIIVTPPGSRIDPMRPAQLADQFDEFLANEVAMVFDVDPISLGLSPNVSATTSPFAARELAQASRTVHERTSNKPLLKYMCSFSNAILHRVLSQDDMKFTFSGMDEAQDQAAQTDMLVKQVQSGLISIDEAREELQRTAWGLDETSGPLVYTQVGPVPLNQVIEMLYQQQPMQGGQTAAANTSNSVTASHQPRAVHHPPSSRPVGTHNPRQGLPSGGGLSPKPGGASDTPAHTAARAHQGAPKAAAKAVTAELEALARHVRKGRHITTWVPKFIPGVVMAGISEDLTKGIDIDSAVREALTVALGPEDYEWADAAKAAAPPPFPPGSQQARAQALAQQYQAQVQAAFAQVQAQAAALVAAWLAGTLAVTAAALASMITVLLAKLLAGVLRALWAAAWRLGEDVAGDLLGTAAQNDPQAAQAWMDSTGRDWLEQIAATREDDLAAGLYAAAQDGQDAETITSRIGEWLDAANRATLIAVDQVQRAMNAAMMAVARRLGVVQKFWKTREDALVCKVCRANEDEGWIGFDQVYKTRFLAPPAHPNCRCVPLARVSLNAAAQKLAGGRRYVDLPGEEWWTPRDSSPHGPAMGGGGPMHAAHDADGIQQYVPGGVPGMTAGGEPPRWPGSEAPALVTVSPGTDSAGRGNPPTRGGGTAGEYRDFSGDTHASHPEDADDADWPGGRGRGPDGPRRWPQQGYMGGYWPEGGHGTTQAPLSSPGGGGPRGRPPNAVGKGTSGYSLNRRSGMISLDVPEGTIVPVPGGVTDHHITVVYLGPDVDDDAFMAACERAREAAAAMPGPLAGTLKGIGSFPPSDSSDGKVPAWAGVALPGAERLREALEDLSASEHKNWKPHVTLAYVDAGEPLPDPVPPTPVTFTHLSVHRGHDEVARFPLGPAAPVGKGAPADDETRLAWLLLRARDEDGKYRFLLQQRPDGSWGMPGGKPHAGEDPWQAAIREVTEEIGDLPPLTQVRTFHHVEDDGETQVYLWLCDAPYFHPVLDGDTPDETQGAAWFRRKEIANLDLAPKFREDWERGVDLREHVTKAAEHVADPNPVEWRHVYAQMEANFPAAAIAWVKRARWIGPVNIPWSRIDTDDEDKWAASHQPDAVDRFARAISSGAGHTSPSILVQEPGSGRAFIVDGHHRALARRKLGKPVLAYVGNIDPRDRQAALETHSAQVHSGGDPANKSGNAETLREYWAHEAHPGPTDFAYADAIRWGQPGDFDRCTSLVMEHGHMTEEQAHGYCNLEHHRALGYWPAQHARMERGD